MAVYWAISPGRVILIAEVGVSSATAFSSKIQNPIVAIARRWMLAGMTATDTKGSRISDSTWLSWPACSAGLPYLVCRACSPRTTSMRLAGLSAMAVRSAFMATVASVSSGVSLGSLGSAADVVKVVVLAQAVPGVGKVKSRRALDALGVPADARWGDLGAAAQAELIKALANVVAEAAGA